MVIRARMAVYTLQLPLVEGKPRRCQLWGKIILFLLAQTSITICQVIRQHPEDVTGYAFKGAVFSCSATDVESFHWRVNETDIHNDRLSSFKDDLTIDEGKVGMFNISLLSFEARIEHNGTRVQCTVEGEDGLVVSRTAILTIQGRLSSVTDLRITSVNISWTAPFSLDVTDYSVGPDIWYSVIIYIMTDENNPTVVLCTDCDDITDTNYTFTPGYLDPCHVYHFTVIPFNRAGQGESSRNITKAEILFVKDEIKAREDEECNVIFEVLGELDQVNTIFLQDNDNVIGFNNASGIEEGEVTFILPADNYYSVFFELDTDCGVIKNISSSYFTTFDIQNPVAKPSGDNMISISLEFITDSHARGCLLILQDTFTDEDSFLIMKRHGSNQTMSETVMVSAGNYHAYLYDLEDTLHPNPYPANVSPQVLTVNGFYLQPEISSNQENLAIVQNGSNVTIDSERIVSNTSYILLYRVYGDLTLNVLKVSTFPVTMSLEIGSYTFAVFRMTVIAGIDDIEEKPFLRKKIQIVDNIPNVAVSSDHMTPTPTPTPTLRVPPETDANTSDKFLYILVGLIAVIIIIVGILILKFAVWRERLFLKSNGITYRSNLRLLCEACSVSTCKCGAIEKTSEDNDTSGDDDVETRDRHIIQGHTNQGPTSQLLDEDKRYATVVLSSEAKPPPPVDPSKVQYQEIDKDATQRMARTCEAEVDTAPSSGADEDNESTADKRGPPTVESAMSVLRNFAGRWKAIADGLGFNEDMIEEINTNNEMNEACLQDCVEQWVARLGPSWEKISRILEDLGEERCLTVQECKEDTHQVQDAVTSDCQDKAAPTTVIQGESPVITEVEENISTECEIARVEEQEVNGENSAVGISENTSTQEELTSTQVKVFEPSSEVCQCTINDASKNEMVAGVEESGCVNTGVVEHNIEVEEEAVEEDRATTGVEGSITLAEGGIREVSEVGEAGSVAIWVGGEEVTGGVRMCGEVVIGMEGSIFVSDDCSEVSNNKENDTEENDNRGGKSTMPHFDDEENATSATLMAHSIYNNDEDDGFIYSPIECSSREMEDPKLEVVVSKIKVVVHEISNDMPINYDTYVSLNCMPNNWANFASYLPKPDCIPPINLLSTLPRARAELVCVWLQEVTRHKQKGKRHTCSMTMTCFTVISHKEIVEVLYNWEAD